MKTKYLYITLLVVIKILYVYLCVLMLPEEWTSYDFDRDINISNVIYEIVPFCACLYAYVKYLTPGSPISFALTIYFCLYVIPSNSCISISNYSFLYFLSINLFNIVLLCLVGKVAMSSRLNLQRAAVDEFYLDSNKELQNTSRYVTFITCVGVIFYVRFLRGSISLDGIFSQEIYETRMVVAELYMRNMGGPIAYLMLFVEAFYSSMLIIGMYLSLKNKHYFDTALCVFTYLLLFAFEMQKSLLLKPIIVLFMYYLYKRHKVESSVKVFLFGFLVLQLFSLLEYYFLKESDIFSVVIRRMAYMPQYLSHAYYEFFDAHDKLWLTRDFCLLEKVIRIIYPSSYEHGAVTIIAENCFPGVPSPNTVLFGEAFAQFGYLGIIVLPIILAYILKILMKYSLIFGQGASHVLMASFIISLIDIQVLAPRGILIVVIFIVISSYVKRKCIQNNNNLVK